ncbi:MAG: PPC domain-containing protein [Pirellulaceae bacterium]
MTRPLTGPSRLWTSFSGCFSFGTSRPIAALLMLAVLPISLAASPARLFAQLPESRLDWLQPCGGAPGTTFELTVGGADLDEANALAFSHPGITAAVKQTEATDSAPAQPVYGTFVVSIAEEVPAGLYEVRVSGRFGESNTRRFMVDRLETVVDSGNNRQLESAQSISVGQVVDGRIEANARDYYRLELAAGETVTLEGLAPSLDSRAKPIIEVADLDGNELARYRGIPGYTTSGEFTANEAGTYIVAIYDLVFAGGADYFYRLRVHRGPVLVDASPAIIPAGQTTEVRVTGRQLGAGAQANEQGLQVRSVAVDAATVGDPITAARGQALLPLSAANDLQAVPVQVVDDNGVTASAAVVVSDLPIVSEIETDDEWERIATATPITLPCIIDGRFGEARDRDWFEFTAKAGERWVIEVFSARLGMPTDPLIAIHKVNPKEDGSIELQQISVVDDAGDRPAMIGSDFDYSSDDPTLTFDVPADATYRIALDDQFGGNRDQQGVRYALRIRPLAPQVRLLVEPPLGRPGNGNQAVIGTFELRRGGTEKLQVRLQRLEGRRRCRTQRAWPASPSHLRTRRRDSDLQHDSIGVGRRR